MPIPPVATALLSSLLLVAACDSKDDAAGPAQARAEGKADGGEAAGEGGDGDTKAAAAKADGGEAAAEGGGGGTVFAKEDTKQRCRDLTAEFLAETFGFPVDKLDEQKPKDDEPRCNWQWKEGEDLFYAQVGMMWVLEDEEAAKRHYGNVTASKTQAEIEADMKMIEGEAAKKDELKAGVGKKLTTTATSSFAKMTGDEGVTYEPVEGIGDEAKVSSRDGSVWVRIGNAHLVISAYRGPDKKMLMENGRPVADIDRIMANEREWIRSTFDQRKEASLQLAKAYAPRLAKIGQ